MVRGGPLVRVADVNMTIEIKVNGSLVGGAVVTEQPGLAGLSDYEVEIVEKGDIDRWVSNLHVHEKVGGHERAQSVWALVAKIARASGRAE